MTASVSKRVNSPRLPFHHILLALTALPTIDTTACTALGACTGFPGVLPTACIKCLIGGGFVADWAALAAVPVMSRLPLAEAGFTAQVRAQLNPKQLPSSCTR
jgi:hypothetical protein